MTVVRAIDLGYGNVKMTVSGIYDNGNLDCCLFPSVAIPVAPNQINTEALAKRDTVLVPVNDTYYECGPDVLIASSLRTNRTLHEDYVNDPSYEALMKAAIAYMNEPVIDQLVLGLPVKLFNIRHQALKDKWTGEIVVSSENGESRSVLIKNVSVLMQPAGCLLDVAASNNVANPVTNSRNLVLDGGFYSLDWFASVGLKPMDDRCDGNDLGASKILRVIGDEAGKSLGRNFDNLNMIDSAVRSGYFKFGNKKEPVTPYLDAANPLIDQCLNDVFSSIKNADDFDNVVLGGGSGFLYESAVAERFVDHNILKVSDPIFSIVRGLQVAGEKVAKKMAKAA